MAAVTEQQKQTFDIDGHLERLRSDQSLAKIVHLSTLSVLFSYMGLTFINYIYYYALLTHNFSSSNNVSSAVHKMVQTGLSVLSFAYCDIASY